MESARTTKNVILIESKKIASLNKEGDDFCINHLITYQPE